MSLCVDRQLHHVVQRRMPVLRRPKLQAVHNNRALTKTRALTSLELGARMHLVMSLDLNLELSLVVSRGLPILEEGETKALLQAQ